LSTEFANGYFDVLIFKKVLTTANETFISPRKQYSLNFNVYLINDIITRMHVPLAVYDCYIFCYFSSTFP